VGSIIGKKGDIVKRFREESGAKINITDGSCPERIVTVIGTSKAILKAFTLICAKFEEDLEALVTPSIPRPPITFRLVVPASQCGSLIGKGGSKIKEIREITGASIQVASEMLPNSTERAVTISGGSEAITQCIYNICNIMAESPPKGPTIPYKPQQFSVPPPSPVSPTLSCQSDSPMVMSSSTSYVSPPPHCPPVSLPMQIDSIQVLPPMFSQQALPFPQISPCLRYSSFPAPHQTMYSLALHPGHEQSPMKQGLPPQVQYCPQVPELGKGGMLPPGGLSHINGLTGFGPGVLNPAALAALSGMGRGANTHQTHEMTVPNEIIGCVIGKGGSKIAEIRQISGAMIRISNCEDRDAPANLDRTITISGNCESVALAQYLINMRISMETASLGGLAGFQYISPNHIVKSPVH
jgi:transcription antitermination factor NusA-like protein